MSAAPTFPFEGLLSQLSQAMSAPGDPPVLNQRGTQAGASDIAGERLVWIPDGIETVIRPFQLPDSVTPDDQAWDHKVEIHAATELRVGELHSLLVAWLDLLVGPEQGAAPSEDYAPAEATGTIDLMSVLYPWAGLDGLTLTFTAPYPLTVAMPAGPLASPAAVAVGVASALRAAGSPVLAGLAKGDNGERYLKLTFPADPLSTEAPTFALDPAAPASACAAFGLDDTPATGAAPSMPYRPGYRVGKSEKGPMGGTVDAGAWGLVVPVRLFAPIKSIAYQQGTIQRVDLRVAAATSTGEEIAVENPAP